MNLKKIPVIIISYNRLSCVKNMVEWLLSLGQENIIILDNDSHYIPLLEWYDEIKKNNKVKILKSDKNYGHRAIVTSGLLEYLKKSWFIYTDPDLYPLETTPNDIIEKCYSILNKYQCNKVGPSLDISNIPDAYLLKSDVIKHELNFWKNEDKTPDGDQFAPIDTTFAMYRPGTVEIHAENCIRLSPPYTLKHLGWYYDPKNTTEEDDYYYNDIKLESTHWSANNKFLLKY